jgi:hypothetical protein
MNLLPDPDKQWLLGNHYGRSKRAQAVLYLFLH